MSMKMIQIITFILSLPRMTCSKEVSGLRRKITNFEEELSHGEEGSTLIKKFIPRNTPPLDYDESYDFWTRELGDASSMSYAANIPKVLPASYPITNPTLSPIKMSHPTELLKYILSNEQKHQSDFSHRPTVAPTTLNPTPSPTLAPTSKPSNQPTKSPTTSSPTHNPSTNEPTIISPNDLSNGDETIQPTYMGDSVISFHESLFKIFKMFAFLKKTPFYNSNQEVDIVSSKSPTLSPAILESKIPTYVLEQRLKYPKGEELQPASFYNSNQEVDVVSSKSPTLSPTILDSKIPTYVIEQRLKYPKGEELQPALFHSPSKIPTYVLEQRLKYPKGEELSTHDATTAAPSQNIGTKVITSFSKVSEEKEHALVPTTMPTALRSEDSTRKPTKDPTISPTNPPTEMPTSKPINEATTNIKNKSTEISSSSTTTSEISCDIMTSFFKKRIIKKALIEASGENAFNNPNSPQSKAINWMINDDNISNICPNKDKTFLQRYAAALFYFSTGGENWKNSYDFLDPNKHECKWSNRMICDNNDKIRDIILYNNNVAGVIPKEIDIFSSLKTLSLTKGNIGGAIPETLYNITTLKVIELSDNKLKGKISNKLYVLSQLQVLNLNNNMLNGPIQSEISYLKNLSSLKLHSNKFYGLVRRELKDLTSLEIGTLHYNNFTGRVPTRMCNLFKPSNGKLQTLTSDCEEPNSKVECVCCTRCY